MLQMKQCDCKKPENNKKIKKKVRVRDRGKITKVRKTTGIWMVLLLFFVTSMIGIIGIGAVFGFVSSEMNQEY